MNLPNRIELIITADIATGKVEVRGPLAHKSACVKALAAAIQIVADHVPPILARTMPRPGDVPAANGGTKH